MPSALISTKRFDARFFRRVEQVLAALDHHALELLLLALADGDLVDDRIDALDRTPEAGRIGHVSFDQLAPERPALLGIAHESPHVLPCGEQRLHDVAPHEPRGTRDEDHFAGSRSKFCQ